MSHIPVCVIERAGKMGFVGGLILIKEGTVFVILFSVRE